MKENNESKYKYEIQKAKIFLKKTLLLWQFSVLIL